MLQSSQSEQVREMMVEITLAYGEHGLRVQLPNENVTLVEPTYRPGLADKRAAIVEALRNPIEAAPLRELVRSTDRVVVVFSDITRPVPNRTIFPPLLAELNQVPDEQILLLNGTGLHRPNTPDELARLLGNHGGQPDPR